MASSGKKGKRVKGKTVNLTDFLADDKETPQAGYAVATTTKKGMDWAAEMEKEAVDDYHTLDVADTFILPTMPRAARETNVDLNSIPSKPPFTAFIANLPYDIDQEDILKFFKMLKVKSVRLPRDSGDTGRYKGFGYTDFDDRDSLIEALAMNDSVIKGRKIRIHIADNQEGERDKDRKDDRGDRTVGDWRSAPREDFPSRDDNKYRNGSERFSERSERDRPQDRDWHSSERDRYGSRGFDRSACVPNDRDERGRSGERCGSSGGERDRGGSGFDRYDGGGGGGGYRDRERDRERDRYNNYDRGPDRSSRGGPRRDYGDFRERDRGYERRDQKDDYSSRGPRTYDRVGNSDKEPEKELADTPRERPRLQLKPRSVPLDAPKEIVLGANTSIFGGAKPVDTAAREREIEERLQHEKEGKFLPPSRDLELDRKSKDSDRWESNRDHRRFEKSEEPLEGDGHIKEDLEEGSDKNKKSNTGGGTYPRNSPRSSTSGYYLSSRPESERSGTSQSEPEDDRSEKAVPIGKPPSPRKEDNKAILAPPPKENAWEKRNVQEGDKDTRYYNTVPRTKRSSSISSNASSGEKDSGRRPSFDRPPSGRKNAEDNNKRRDNSQGRWGDDWSSRASDDARDDSTSRRRGGDGHDRASDRGSSGGGRGGGSANNQGRDRNWGRREIPSQQYYSRSAQQDRGEERRTAEVPKYEDPKAVYASANKFSLLNDDDLDKGSGSD